jgi:5'-nucleotidase / UDP-sugar diphosphatase
VNLLSKRSVFVAIGFSSLLSLAACGGGNDPDYQLQILHFADVDGDQGVSSASVGNFSGLVAKFKAQFPNNTLVLSSGDNYNAGPRADVSSDESLASLFQSIRGSEVAAPGVYRGDIAFTDLLGVQAAALGNHELDKGTAVFASVVAAGANWNGTGYPYLSYNADFSGESSLATLVVPNGTELSEAKGKLAGWVKTTVNGETIGIIGASAPYFAKITSPGNIVFKGCDAACDGTNSASLAAALAPVLQAGVNEMTAAGINKIVMLSHMQKIDVELELAKLLTGVDVIIAGGSNARFGNANLRVGERSAGKYPTVVTTGSNVTAVVNVDGDYKYLGRLIVPFDSKGNVLENYFDYSRSDAYATSDNPTAGGVTPNSSIVALKDALLSLVTDLEGDVYGVTSVYLEGARPMIRSEETNLGNLTADSMLWYARSFDSTVSVALKNGGGIRASIGQIVALPGSSATTKEPPTAIQGIREEGGISALAIKNTLAFNNGLALVSLTVSELKAILEHGLKSLGGGAWPHVSGLAVSFDPSRPEGDRIRSLKVGDDVLISGGVIQGDANRFVRAVTLGFLANGGDSYPYPKGATVNRVDLFADSLNTLTGSSTFADVGSEQDALARYLRDSLAGQVFDKAETPPALDERIQNLSVRSDTVLQ